MEMRKSSRWELFRKMSCKNVLYCQIELRAATDIGATRLVLRASKVLDIFELIFFSVCYIYV